MRNDRVVERPLCRLSASRRGIVTKGGCREGPEEQGSKKSQNRSGGEEPERKSQGKGIAHEGDSQGTSHAVNLRGVRGERGVLYSKMDCAAGKRGQSGNGGAEKPFTFAEQDVAKTAPGSDASGYDVNRIPHPSGRPVSRPSFFRRHRFDRGTVSGGGGEGRGLVVGGEKLTC